VNEVALDNVVEFAVVGFRDDHMNTAPREQGKLGMTNVEGLSIAK
jgi:hypothetical protein